MAKILVAVNQPTERDGLALVMEFAGHRCNGAGSLQEAVASLKSEVYDLVLADSTLADTGMEQIVRTLKTARPGTSVMVLAEDAGPSAAADEAITLPFSPVEGLATQFSAVKTSDVFLVLLPEDQSLKFLATAPKSAGLLNKLAVLYHSQQKYTQAEKLYQRAEDLSKKGAEDTNRELATILNNLALLYSDQKRYSEAEPLFKRSLAIVEKSFGPTHPKTARRLKNLVELYRAQDMRTAALPLERRLETMQRSSRS